MKYSFMFLVVLILGCGPSTPIALSPPSNPTKPALLQWEYDIVRNDEIPANFIFNGYGEGGWELVQIIERKDGGYLIIYKRPKGVDAPLLR